MRLKKNVHGRSMTKEILPLGTTIKELILQLRTKAWDVSKLTKEAKVTFDDCKFDMIFSEIKGKKDNEISLKLRENILTLFDDQVGWCCAGIYLIIYLKFEAEPQDLYETVKNTLKKDNAPYHPRQVKKIIRYALENSKYLGLINESEELINRSYVLEWGYYAENPILKNAVRAIQNEINDSAEKSWYEDVYRNRHALAYRISNNFFHFNETSIEHKKIKKNNKIRKVYMLSKMTDEYVVMKYLKGVLDSHFCIKYPNRDAIISELFALINNIDALSTYTIYRYDIKDFFESIPTNYIWENYIKESRLDWNHKQLLKQIIILIDKCYAGIPVSNVFVEIAGKQFDDNLRAKFSQYGLIFYARYVDDGIIILNKKINENEIVNILNQTLQTYFGENIQLHPTKKNYVLKSHTDTQFDYLGYLFIRKNSKYKYGITQEKRDKYESIIVKIVDDYLIDQNVELLRQRINYFISRVVYYNRYSFGTNCGSWDVVGLSANYKMLREAIKEDKVERKTETFLKDIVFCTLMRELHGKKVYFISVKSKHYYSLWNSIKCNKSIVFHSKIGWSQQYLCRQIRKLNYSQPLNNKTYRDCVNIYSSLIKLQG